MFLTTGRSGIAAFANSDAWFLIRVVTAPDGTALPRRHKLVLSRGPYGYHDEFALLREQRIDALVTKNSGGKMTRAKLDAAAALGISVVMIARPLLPAGVAAVDSVHRPPCGWPVCLAGEVVGLRVGKQRIARSSDTGSDGAHRAAAHRRGVRIGQPEQLGQQQRFPLVGG